MTIFYFKQKNYALIDIPSLAMYDKERLNVARCLPAFLCEIYRFAKEARGVTDKTGEIPARSRRCIRGVMLHGCHWETGKAKHAQ